MNPPCDNRDVSHLEYFETAADVLFRALAGGEQLCLRCQYRIPYLNSELSGSLTGINRTRRIDKTGGVGQCHQRTRLSR
jgi:hypothetical protein